MSNPPTRSSGSDQPAGGDDRPMKIKVVIGPAANPTSASASGTPGLKGASPATHSDAALPVQDPSRPPAQDLPALLATRATPKPGSDLSGAIGETLQAPRPAPSAQPAEPARAAAQSTPAAAPGSPTRPTEASSQLPFVRIERRGGAPGTPPPSVMPPVGTATGRFEFAALGWAVALFAYCLAIFFTGLNEGAKPDQPDAWVGQTAREMLARDEWIVPIFSGEVRLNKFPLPYWQVMAASELLARPIDATLIRGIGAAYATTMVLIAFLFMTGWAGVRAGVFAGFTLASSAFLFEWSHRGASDIQVSFWCMLSLFCVFNAYNARKSAGWMFLAYLAAGVGMLSKGPIPLVAVALPSMAYVLCLWLFPRALGRDDLPSSSGARLWQLVRRSGLWWGVPLFIAVWGWWTYALIAELARLQHPDLPWGEAFRLAAGDVGARWQLEFFDRAKGELANVATEQFWKPWQWYGYYVPFLFFYTLPFALSVPVALAWPFLRKNRPHRQVLIFFLAYFATIFLFFTFSFGKEGRYSVAFLPPILLLLGHHFAAAFHSGAARNRALVNLTCWLAILSVPIGLTVAGLWIEDNWLRQVLGETYTQLRIPKSVDVLMDPPLILRGYVLFAVVLGLGFVAAALAFMFDRRPTSFALIVLTATTAFLVFRSSLDEPLRSRDQRAVYAAADHLRGLVRVRPQFRETSFLDRVSSEPQSGPQFGPQFGPRFELASRPGEPVRLFASDNRNAQLIWATELPIPRAVTQAELDDGERNLLSDVERTVPRIFELLREDEPTLILTELKPLELTDKGTVPLRDGYVLRLVGEQLQQTEKPLYIWFTTQWGRAYATYAMTVIGNFPPPNAASEPERLTLEKLGFENPTTMPSREELQERFDQFKQKRGR